MIFYLFDFSFFFVFFFLIDRIDDTRHLCTRLRVVGI